MSQLYDPGSLWFIPAASDGFPTAAHGVDTTLANSVFASNRTGVKLDGYAITTTGTGTDATLVFKDTAAGALFTIKVNNTSGSNHVFSFGPNGLDIGSGFSANMNQGTGSGWAVLIWYRLGPN